MFLFQAKIKSIEYKNKKNILNREFNLLNKTIILCGGTGFYIRAAIDDYNFPKGEQIDNPARDKYQKYYENYGCDSLWDLLNKKDPDSAKIIHKNNVVRVIRALEICDEGLSYAQQVSNLSKIEQMFDCLFFGLKVDPKILNDRINKRVDRMLDLGLVKEVEKLLSDGYRSAITSANAIGYKEIVDFLDNKCSLSEASERIKIATRQYAKRQRT